MEISKPTSILLCDDSQTFLMYVGILLKRLGYHAYLTKCGDEAIKLAKEKNPSVIVLDHVMPKMDGLSCLDIIRSDVKLNDTPVLILTAYGNESTRDKYKELGYCGFLNKPINVSEFYNTIKGCVKHDDHRGNIRAPLRLRVVIECQNERRELFASNLSNGGMFLRTAAPFDNGTEMNIVFNVDDKGAIEVKGKVIYSKRLFTEIEQEPGMGIKFLDIPEDLSQRLSCFVVKEIADDLIFEGEDIEKI